jgi:hypothetical protein
MPHQDRDVSAIVLVSICAVLVVASTWAVRSLAPAAIEGPPVDLLISNISVSPPGQGTTAISFEVRNVGNTPVNLSASLAGIASVTTFSPRELSAGGTSLGHLLITNVARFNGANSSVTVLNSSSLNFPQFTIEFGFEYANKSPDQQMILGKGSSSANAFYFYSFRSVNNVNDFTILSDGQRADFQLGDIFGVGAWYDLVYTVGAQQIVAYLDGSPIMSWVRPGPVFAGNGDPIQIGNCFCGGYFFNGSLSFVDYYSTALSAGEVEATYLQPSNPTIAGLQFALSFGGAQNGDVPDISGHGHDGSESNLTFGSPVKVGEALTLTVEGTTPAGEVFPVSVSVPRSATS